MNAIETIKCQYCRRAISLYELEGEWFFARHYDHAGRGPRRQCPGSHQRIAGNWRDDPTYQGKAKIEQ